MKNIKKYLYTFIRGILAGICIGIGGWVFVKTREAGLSTVTAAFLFSVGLVLVCTFGFFLYTGKICYLPQQIKDKKGLTYSIELVLGLIGNYIGATILGIILRNIFTMPSFVTDMVNVRLNYEFWELIFLGFGCGMLIYFAVEGFLKISNPVGKYLVLIFCVGSFIVCGFEHCVADMLYFAIAGVVRIDVLLLIALGNSLGGIIVPVLRGLFNE